jgi:hypothetical protein
MTLWMLFALLLVVMTAASMVPMRTPPPQVIVVQMPEPPVSTGSGCLPLLLLVGAIVAAVALF